MTQWEVLSSHFTRAHERVRIVSPPATAQRWIWQIAAARDERIGVWMSQIRVLSDELVNQIAAGEVVERPASIVKELVENALDAGATRLDVAIREGGLRWIQVVDDGSGMSRADAQLAFRRHATSKIRAAEDLASVSTLGFRGEALPSIASVSRVRMRTRRNEDPMGVELAGEGEGIASVRDVACPAGTRIEVGELFARVPARRKFMKSPITEGNHVVQWLERLALARPDVRITLERDDKRVLFLPATSILRERVLAILPSGAGERLVEIHGEIPAARIDGFASPADVHRGSASDIHVFVNARPVRDRLLFAAVREAYRDVLPPGRHPIAVLYLKVDPGEVDVNVHPAKWEVRFADPASISRLVRRSIQSAIGLRGTYAGSVRAQDARRWLGPPSSAGGASSHVAGWPTGPHAFAGSSGSAAFDRVHDGADDVSREGLGLYAPPAPGEGAAPVRFRSLRYVGPLLGTYLVFEAPGRMVLLDQHAAHERVLFERMRRALLDGRMERQALLVPLRFEVSRSAADALLEHEKALDRAGFEIDVGEASLQGGVHVVVRAVPARIGSGAGANADWRAILEETAAGLRDPSTRDARDGIEGALHRVLATAACHAAVRKGDRLDPLEVERLLEDLDETLWVPACPHGRPILAVLDEAELERRFLRR